MVTTEWVFNDATGSPSLPRLGGDGEGYAETGSADIGRYSLMREIGKGAFSTVYWAEDRNSNAEYAIKILSESNNTIISSPHTSSGYFSNFESYEKLRRYVFLNEIKCLNKLIHPGIVCLHDYCASDRGDYLVLDRIKGANLQYWVEEKKFISMESGLRILDVLLKTLRYIHDCGYVYRDMKPANIMMNSAGIPILVDFGSCSEIENLEFAPHFVSRNHAPPEALIGPANQTNQSDIFSAFSTVFWAVLGQEINALNPFHQKLMDLEHRFTEQIRNDITRLFETGLSAADVGRFANAQEALESLSPIREALFRLTADEELPAAGTQVFVSYSSDDVSFAEPLAEFLKGNMLEVWRDHESVKGGDRWIESIEEGISGSDIVFVICTNNSVGIENVSEFVFKEVHRAIEHRKRLIPIVFPGFSIDPSIELLLAGVQKIDSRSIDFGRPDTLRTLLQLRAT